MTETQVAVRSVVVNGVAATSAMSGADILNAHLKAAGNAPVSTPHVTFSGPQGHPHTVVPDGAGSAFASNPPPSPAALEAGNKPANVAPYDPAKVAAYDAEMRAAGKQLPLATPATDAPSEIDQSYLTKLNARYTELMRNMEMMPPSEARDRNIAKIRGEYDVELREVYEGRRLGEKRSEFRARRDGTAAAPAANKPAATTANMPAGWDAAIDVATKASNKYGYAPASAITGPLLHGYTIPAGREFHVADLVDSLRMARKGNLTQQQVADIAGWTKA